VTNVTDLFAYLCIGELQHDWDVRKWQLECPELALGPQHHESDIDGHPVWPYSFFVAVSDSSLDILQVWIQG
jgi:hypothetical protein